jgi:hypothetical protein
MQLAHLPPEERGTAWDLEFIAYADGWEEFDQWRYRIVPAGLAADMLMQVWPAFVLAYAQMVADYEREHAAELEAEREQFTRDCADIAAIEWLENKAWRRVNGKVQQARAMGFE